MAVLRSLLLPYASRSRRGVLQMRRRPYEWWRWINFSRGGDHKLNINIPQGTPEYAVDAISVQANAWGAKLTLGSHRADGNTMDAKLVAALSPQTMKALYFVLKRQVEHFEEKWGPINLPTDFDEEIG